MGDAVACIGGGVAVVFLLVALINRSGGSYAAAPVSVSAPPISFTMGGTVYTVQAHV